jgi:hypothetical protein
MSNMNNKERVTERIAQLLVFILDNKYRFGTYILGGSIAITIIVIAPEIIAVSQNEYRVFAFVVGIVALSVTTMAFSNLLSKNIKDSITEISDEKRLLKTKKDYLQSILNTLKLDVDND